MTDIASLMLAEERVALWLFTTKPADPAKAKLAELNAAENVADRVFADGTYFRAVGSESVSRPLLCGGNNSGLGRSNYEAQVDIARFLDASGHGIVDEDFLWEACKKKGATLWFATRVGPKWDAPAAEKDEISLFQVMTDNPQDPQTFADYIEKIVPMSVTQAWLDQTLSAT